MKTINQKDSKKILEKMCQAISIKYEDIDFAKSNWFQDYEWTIEQENEFKKWLGKFLYDKKYVVKGRYRGQDRGQYEAAKIISNYGWKIKELK